MKRRSFIKLGAAAGMAMVTPWSRHALAGEELRGWVDSQPFAEQVLLPDSMTGKDVMKLAKPRLKAICGGDAAAAGELFAALREASRERVVVVIAHRLSTIRSADQILFIDEGRIIERGSHEELMARPDGAYRSFVELQARGAA